MAITKIQSESLNLADTYDFTGTVTGAGVVTPNASGIKNTPAFGVRVSSQSIANDTDTKVAYDDIMWDTDNAFASNKFTVPSGQGGKYYLQAHTQIPGIDDGELGQIFIFINGASDQLTNVRVYSSGSNQIFRMITAYTAELNAGDYVEVYVYQNSGDAQTAANQFFTGHKIIGA